MRVLIDFDDCVCENHFIPVINKYLGTNYTEEDFTNIYMEKTLFPSTEDRRKFYNYFSTVDSYENLKLRENAYEVIKRLVKKHEVYFVTNACHYEQKVILGRQLTDKWNYISKELPFFPLENVVFVAKKHIFNSDVIVDDRVENLTGEYKNKILFTCCHNRNITNEQLEAKGIIRANGWKEVEEIISQLDRKNKS